MQTTSKEKLKVVIVEGEKVTEDTVEPSELYGDDWDNCIIPSLLGIPLKIKRLSFHVSLPSIELAACLVINPKTGAADIKWKNGMGIVMFARTDVKYFSSQTFSTYTDIFLI